MPCTYNFNFSWGTIWIETKKLRSLSACHNSYPTFQVNWVRNQTAAESSCGCLTMTPLFLLIVFYSVASLTEPDLLKMTWLTGNNWQITRLLMHRGREWQFKSESCLRVETQWGLNEGFLPPVFLCTCKWHGVMIWSMQCSENMPHDGPPCQRKQLYHCLTNLLTTEENVYPIFQSVYTSADAFEHVWYIELLPEQAQISQGENAYIAVLSRRWTRTNLLNATVSCRIPLTPP